MFPVAGIGAAIIAVAATLTAPAPAHAQPQCQYGPDVTADCPTGCVEDPSGPATPCTGPLLAPLFPPGPDVKVGVEGGVGFGFGF